MTKRQYGDPLASATRRRNDNYHLRDAESSTFLARAIPIKLRDDLDSRWLPLLRLDGYKQKEKLETQRDVARQCLHNLILSGLPGGTVADTRSTSNAADRMRIGVWKVIEAAGLLIACIGSDNSGKLTRYQATEKLLTPYREWAASELVSVSRERTVGSSKASWQSLIMLKVEGQNECQSTLPKVRTRRLRCDKNFRLHWRACWPVAGR